MSLRDHLRVVVVGAGALGSELCAQLAGGYRWDVRIVEPDRLVDRNISLSRLYLQLGEDARPGQSKAEAVYQYATRQGIRTWKPYVMEVADVGAGEFQDAQLIFSCTDNSLARVETQWLARLLGIPMIDGGLFGAASHGGRVSYFTPHVSGACYLCGMQDYRRAEVLAYALSASLGCAFPAEDTVPMGNAASSAEAVANAMLRVATEPYTEESFALRLNAEGEERIALRRSATCTWHDAIDHEQMLCLPHDQPLRVHLVEHPGERLQTEWPVCIEGRCDTCGKVQPVLRRLSWTRRSFACAQCGSVGSMQPLRVLESIGIHDPHAEWTPRQLGLPLKHLFQCRKPMVFSMADTFQEME